MSLGARPRETFRVVESYHSEKRQGLCQRPKGVAPARMVVLWGKHWRLRVVNISRFLAALVARMAQKGEVKLLGLFILMCVYVSVMCLCVMCLCRPYVHIGVLLYCSVSYFLRYALLLHLKLTDSARLAGQQAPGVLPSLLQCWKCAPGSVQGSLNSSPQVCTASALLTESSPQTKL